MPLTKLDEVCALVVIDLQKVIAGIAMAHPIEGIIDRSAQLARAFRQRERREGAQHSIFVNGGSGRGHAPSLLRCAMKARRLSPALSPEH